MRKRTLREAFRLIYAPRNRQILRLRAKGLTLAEIGRRYGLTKARVQQIVGTRKEANRG